MVLPMNNWTAGLVLTFYVLPFAVFVYRRRYGRYAKQIRRWRTRMTAVADEPFYMRRLTAFERGWIGRSGLPADGWFSAAVAEVRSGRREHMPTCGDYLAEFGRYPKVILTKT